MKDDYLCMIFLTTVFTLHFGHKSIECSQFLFPDPIHPRLSADVIAGKMPPYRVSDGPIPIHYKINESLKKEVNKIEKTNQMIDSDKAEHNLVIKNKFKDGPIEEKLVNKRKPITIIDKSQPKDEGILYTEGKPKQHKICREDGK